ncbi:hypothetical protein V6Z11_A12G149200 [Gossypium hirsutum]
MIKVETVNGWPLLCKLLASQSFFTALILNSVVTLSLSAALIAVNDNSDGPSGVPKEMQIYTSVVASCLSTIGLFASGEWKSLQHEMEVFGTGSVSYVLTLVWTAISWQHSVFGCYPTSWG